MVLLRSTFASNIIRCYSTQGQNFYDILEIPRSSTSKDIKLQFKKMSKKYHPDLNSHLQDEEKTANNDRFIRIVNAYETLKDDTTRKQYDASLVGGGSGGGGGTGGGSYAYNYSYNDVRDKQWNNKYYGEAKNYSGARLNRTRHRVRNFGGTFDEGTSEFSGRHVNYGNRYGVPHFNYDEHLSKHLKFEQRIINRQLTDDERESILRQLTKNNPIDELNEELVTKHLMRQINNKHKDAKIQREHININQSNPFMYQGPQSNYYNNDEDQDGSNAKTLFLVAGATGSLVMFYKILFN